MLALSIFQTVEFYVIAAVVAAAVVAAAALPRRRGPVRTFMYAGDLESGGSLGGDPAIEVSVTPEGLMEIRRTGLVGVSDTGAWSLAVNISAFDVTINERITAGRRRRADDGPEGPAPDSGRALLDCFGRERYHFRYLSEATGRSCAFTLTVNPGARIRRTLEV